MVLSSTRKALWAAQNGAYRHIARLHLSPPFVSAVRRGHAALGSFNGIFCFYGDFFLFDERATPFCETIFRSAAAGAACFDDFFGGV